MATETLAERRQRYIAGLLIRVVICATFIGVFAVTASVIPPAARGPFRPATFALVLLILINYPFWVLGKHKGFPLEDFYAHWLVDLFLVTLILHTLGGVDLPCGFGAYLIMIVTSAVFLSERAAVIVATGSTILFDGLVVLEGVGAIFHQGAVWDHHYSQAAQVIVVLAANVFFYLFAFLVGSLSRQLKVVNVQLSDARDELAQYSRNLEQKVRVRTTTLEQRNREIEEFVHIVTHDLRNTSVGVAELARRLLELEDRTFSPKGQRYAQHLRDDTRILNQMLNHLLALFRVDHESSQVATVDLKMLVEAVIGANARRIAEKRIEIQVGELPELPADRVQIRHVLANLIDNAVKYSGDKASPRIEIRCVEDGDEYRIIVKDNGIGIPENQRDRILQLYQRGTQQSVGGVVQGGEGIGLAIAKRMVERWGGKLEVDSTVGSGSTFCFTIPKKGAVGVA